MKIICDTNIWYNIGENKILEDKIENLELVATYLNVTELGSTENLLRDQNLIRNAMSAMIKYSCEIRLVNPIEYILKIENENYRENLTVGEERLRSIEEFLKLDSNEVKQIINRQEFISKIREFDRDLDESTNFINNKLIDIRKNIRQNIGKNIHRKRDSIFIVKEFIKTLVNVKTTNPVWDNFNWIQIDLLINMIDEFFTELEVSGLKFKKNDWFDILNFVYVGPGEKYWTMEKKSWARLFKEKEKFADYVFE